MSEPFPIRFDLVTFDTPSTEVLAAFWSEVMGLVESDPRDITRSIQADPVLRAIDRLHFVPMVALAALSWQIGGWAWLGAFCLSTTLLYHGVATVNSVAHLAGSQPFATGDASRNNGWVALITLGEGWHNLHHAFKMAGALRRF